MDDIAWPGGGTTDFESDTLGSVPSGFTSSGHADWTVVSDGVHARGASGKSVKAGTISKNKETNLDIIKTVGAGTLTFWAWISSEQFNDLLQLYVINGGTTYGPFFNYAPGQYGHENDVGYPASNPDTIAVGASNDGGISGEEERSDYSQFGADLDIVAPSSGGGQGITTTDRMGNAGYNPPSTGTDLSNVNYTENFGGTSSATPLVAGIVADIIADDPALTASEIRTKLRDGADKIGPYAYSGGRNDHYGYGRVNLLNSMYSCLPPAKIDSAYYSSLRDAYVAAGDGGTIKSQAQIFNEDLDINDPIEKSVTIIGGYDCDYNDPPTGKTILKGNLTISNGTLIIENFELQ